MNVHEDASALKQKHDVSVSYIRETEGMDLKNTL
jgi:hypothetical protein